MYTVLLAYLLPSSFMKLQISTGALTKKGTGYFFTRFHQGKRGQGKRGQAAFSSGITTVKELSSILEKRGQATFSSGITTVKELSSILGKKLPVPFFFNDINHALLDVPESLKKVR